LINGGVVQIEQVYRAANSGWRPQTPGQACADAQLALVFGSRALLQPAILDEIQRAYPGAFITGCSTAGEICGDDVFDETIVVTAIRLDKGTCAGVSVDLAEVTSSEAAGELLAGRIPNRDVLRHVVAFSDGLEVNGTALLKGMTKVLLPHVVVTDGLAADGAQFKSTAVVVKGTARSGVVVAVGFYGAGLHIGYGSLGGWDPFGPERLVTRARANVLFELDGQPALALYKRYLGEEARDLPGSGLRFPLSIRTTESDRGVVRTILGVSEADGSITFAGDVPEGAYARLMRANFDRLIDGAAGAAQVSTGALDGHRAECALLISCVGRKIVLQQRVEEEIEGVRDVVGRGATLAGFYSYGELGPFEPAARCELHNETMTVTTFSER
jgi:hypothetical protein